MDNFKQSEDAFFHNPRTHKQIDKKNVELVNKGKNIFEYQVWIVCTTNNKRFL